MTTALVTAFATNALAAPSDAAKAVSGQAAKAYKAGDYARASELFESAWRLDKGDSRLLYNAARCAQLGGKPERAEGLYRAFMKLPERDATAEEKARDYLRVLDVKRAESKAEQARKAEESGEHGKAALLYAAAADMVPDRHIWRFRAAQAARMAGDDGDARANLQRYLKDAPADAAEREQATRALARLNTPKSAPKAADKPASADKPTVIATQPASLPRVRGIGDHLLLGATAVGVGAALFCWYSASTLEDELDGKLKDRDKNGLIVGIKHGAAVEMADDIASYYTLLGASIGAAAAAGTWWWLRGDAPARVTLVPVGPGAMLVGRF